MCDQCKPKFRKGDKVRVIAGEWDGLNVFNDNVSKVFIVNSEAMDTVKKGFGLFAYSLSDSKGQHKSFKEEKLEAASQYSPISELAFRDYETYENGYVGILSKDGKRQREVGDFKKGVSSDSSTRIAQFRRTARV